MCCRISGANKVGKVCGSYRMAQTSHWTFSVACGICASVYKGLGAETSFCKLQPGIKDKKNVNVT